MNELIDIIINNCWTVIPAYVSAIIIVSYILRHKTNEIRKSRMSLLYARGDEDELQTEIERYNQEHEVSLSNYLRRIKKYYKDGIMAYPILGRRVYYSIRTGLSSFYRKSTY